MKRNNDLNMTNSPMLLHISDYKIVLDKLNTIKWIKTNKKVSYLNAAISFDIETSSFKDYNGDKCAIMYIWMMNIGGLNVYGRTWGEFMQFISDLSENLSLDITKRIIIYVHNLSYEFQFIKDYFKWHKVFALETRKPVYAVSNMGLEFRCSYLLSGYSLEKLATQLKEHEIRKLVGNLDYSLLRHSQTVLSDDELAYCINDVEIVSFYIQERIESDGDITKIPLTKTGYVRRHCKRNLLSKKCNENCNDYRRFIKTLTLSKDEYLQLKRAFQGGFTHANPFYSGKVVKDVSSFDFTSSYPSVMVAEKFPMNEGEQIRIESREQFDDSLRHYCCLFDAEFIGIQAITFFENYISISRCWGVVKPVVNNGRVVCAERLRMTLTEQDFMIINRMYEWEQLKITNFRRYKKTYLPTKFVESILQMYEDKTKLKNIAGREYDYARSKEMLNSAYGMIVTDIIRDENTYTDEWIINECDIDKQIDNYNLGRGRFLFYPWGVWVTAYARRNLFTAIMECNNDYVYSDTDSVKIINKDSHLKYISDYNYKVRLKLQRALDFHSLDSSLIEPLTQDGIMKPLGVWDYEGCYELFKTLGAKRYLVFKDGEYELTVSGLNKRVAIDYLTSNYDNVFDAFSDGLYVPKGHTGKMIHTYIDERRQGIVKDYKGVISEYSEKSSVHLEDADYSLNLAYEYADYLRGLQHKED